MLQLEAAAIRKTFLGRAGLWSVASCFETLRLELANSEHLEFKLQAARHKYLFRDSLTQRSIRGPSRDT